ncbi:brevican core protein-like isoform X2 [Ruditapes philippinarum]|uniref:brevican core protein-like isoform X2 n=1 Tax=Ruditapes philippinarum TaxID=129788 RepID=UPI00295B2200|nr:brevican core protein-like isoform X2 [Ruditapes philippinarum]
MSADKNVKCQLTFKPCKQHKKMWQILCMLTCIMKLCVCGGNVRDITDCSNGAFLLEGSCFKYIATNNSWSDANKFCHDMNGGHLAIVDSASIFDKIKSMAIQRNTKYMWLGANDNDHNGVYQWVNGHRCCPNFWIPGQPDNGGGNQRCLALWQNEKDLIGFDDGTCETKVRFVCQSKGYQSIQHCISHTCLNDVPTCNACENGFAPVGYPSHCFGTVDNFWVGGQLLQTLKQQWLSDLPPTHARWSS